MEVNEYQEMALSTEIYTSAAYAFTHAILVNPPISPTGEKFVNWLKLAYCTGKLNGEAGEIAEFVFKNFRGNKGILSNDEKGLLAKELGDVLWYVANIADLIGFQLEDIMQMNIDKLQDRKDRGVIHGYGDER